MGSLLIQSSQEQNCLSFEKMSYAENCIQEESLWLAPHTFVATQVIWEGGSTVLPKQGVLGRALFLYLRLQAPDPDGPSQ